MGKLTAAQTKHAKPGRHGDGRGLYLQVIGGSKTWVLRYEHRKRERWDGPWQPRVRHAGASARASVRAAAQAEAGEDRSARASPGSCCRSPHRGADELDVRTGGPPVHRNEIVRMAQRRVSP